MNLEKPIEGAFGSLVTNPSCVLPTNNTEKTNKNQTDNKQTEPVSTEVANVTEIVLVFGVRHE
jgi:hypothetical protein